ncbi:MAG: lipoyl(octanoyl) transferase, partial [Bacteroidetes bacterium]|nr:lipoyl(octanoyl) transferase [Bacteroidota bacterium]
MKQLLVVNIGTTKYADAWELQKRIFEARLKQHICDIFLFTYNLHVFTLCNSADENHLLASDGELAQKKVDLFWIDRGGDVTYHGPGQIVGYPILDLTSHYQDIHRYLREL